ncbi:bis(5'-adenosyl)-triphosphatase enpp4-like isoform X3 [Homarus americanus]|uniref:bis(5'-adenosyl)-triphosphatase enpp4-like isoform X3 n=1 Tax=Homarus americanus TaxID=6706 RepID=UPI001C466234|nr:bis(5'-adenosyl)-triphosphatase enpp4-like isoform X3 [Homarus americanus]
MHVGEFLLIVIQLLNNVWLGRTAGMEVTPAQLLLRRKILVVSLDGFGHDYLTKYQWQHLSNLYAHGSYPYRFRNQFVTKTFPNHFSVATGMYEEAHGVVGNNVYEPQLKQTFEVSDAELFTQNPHVSPIWTLNEEHGGHSGCIMWPGCDFAYRGKNVTFWSPYHERAALKESIDTSIQWFTNEQTPANLIFLYHEEPDHLGHIYGPNSSQVLKELKKIDEDIGYLYHMLQLHGLKDTVDVIILSDHGMSAVKEENIIDLNAIVDHDLYNTSGNSPMLQVWTTPENFKVVYSHLMKRIKTEKYMVYLNSDDKLKSWHFTNNTRISEITLLAEEGYVFQDFKKYIEGIKNSGLSDLTDTHGDHGYPVDVPSMEPIFVAVGPSFKQGFEALEFSNIDVYLLLCHMLYLPPGPHNGTFDHINSILMEPVSSMLILPVTISLGKQSVEARSHYKT